MRKIFPRMAHTVEEYIHIKVTTKLENLTSDPRPFLTMLTPSDNSQKQPKKQVFFTTVLASPKGLLLESC